MQVISGSAASTQLDFTRHMKMLTQGGEVKTRDRADARRLGPRHAHSKVGRRTLQRIIRRTERYKKTPEAPCLRKRRSDARIRTHGRAKLHRRKPVSLCGKKSTTFAKANMVRDRRSKRLRSDCRKRGAPAFDFRQRRARRHEHARKPSAIWRRAASLDVKSRPRGLGRFAAH